MFIPDYTITELNLSNKNLDKLPEDIYNYINLIKLDCSKNKLTSLDNLPPNLIELLCSNNKLIYDFIPTLENIKNYNASRK